MVRTAHSPRPIACVDVPALPLQLLAQRHPEWLDRPMAVVAEDRPQGLILWVNEKAYRGGIMPGLRYAAGLSLCRDLCAGEVTGDAIEAGVEQLARTLRSFTPGVEPNASEAGVFWLDAMGLIGLERSLSSWADRIRTALKAQGFIAHVAVSFSRFGSYALARTQRGTTVFDDPQQETLASHNVRLDRLHIAPSVRERLMRLGVHTVGQFLALPADGIGRRFGAEALRLYRLAAGSLPAPLDALAPESPIDAHIELEYPESEVFRLLFIIKRVLPALLEQTAARGHGLSELRFCLLLDDRDTVSDSVRPAESTLDARQILDLVQLKLQTLQLLAGVVEITLTVESTVTGSEQLGLFAEKPKRDLAAANRAFARIRTEFGNLSVVWAKLRQAHLPEASFQWQPLEQAKLPVPRPILNRPLMRRIFDRPVALPHRGHHEPDGWLVRGPEQGPMTTISGPYTVSGGWWVREVHRNYHFVETKNGDLMWVYYDRRRRQWFLQGQVE